MWVKSALAGKNNDINVQLYLFSASPSSVSASVVSQFLSVWDQKNGPSSGLFGSILRPEVRTYAYITPGEQTEQ
jgi:hypothetical protein